MDNPELGAVKHRMQLPGEHPVSQTQLVLIGVRDIISSIILSGGAVYGLVMFIHESFLHPAAAATLIPIVLPAGAAAIGIIFKKR